MVAAKLRELTAAEARREVAIWRETTTSIRCPAWWRAFPSAVPSRPAPTIDIRSRLVSLRVRLAVRDRPLDRFEVTGISLRQWFVGVRTLARAQHRSNCVVFPRGSSIMAGQVYKKSGLKRNVNAFAQPGFAVAHPSDALIQQCRCLGRCAWQKNSAAQTEAVTGRSALGFWRK